MRPALALTTAALAAAALAYALEQLRKRIMGVALSRSRTSSEHAIYILRAGRLIKDDPGSGDTAVALVRQSILMLQQELKRAQQALETLVPQEAPTSRAGHLKTLEDQIGPAPEDRTWRDEWVSMKVASNRRAGKHDQANEDYVRQHQDLDWMIDSLSDAIKRATAIGWPGKRAECFRVLSNPAVNGILSHALASHDPSYSASTHALFNVIHAQRSTQRQEGYPLPSRLYWYRKGFDSLADRDPRWADASVERGDATGFRGLSGSSLVTGTCSASRDVFGEGGFVVRSKGSDGGYVYTMQESDVVCFETADDDEFGCHSPVMTSKESGVFPPNCLFRLKQVVPAGGWESPVPGVFPRQRLLVFTATYRKPNGAACSDDADAEVADGEEASIGAKLCGVADLVTLSYACRKEFVSGLDDVLARPVLTMALEWDRDMEWKDWKGRHYCARDEFQYVCGPAVPLDDCTPGTRDARNGGCMPADFQKRVNKFILNRRQKGHGTFLEDEHAFLTLDEVLAIRLYSGPAFQPINAFLRNVSKLDGQFREQLARHASLTFVATTRHVINGIRKLSAVSTPEEACTHLWRGARGELPKTFWLADEIGTIIATETAFMSTSAERETALHYMAGNGAPNLLWCLKCGPETDAGYHRGADISLLSQFEDEKEWLFPPMTMMEVSIEVTPGKASGALVEECGKHFVCVEAIPTFV